LFVTVTDTSHIALKRIMKNNKPVEIIEIKKYGTSVKKKMKEKIINE
jgi:hypothetical protein